MEEEIKKWIEKAESDIGAAKKSYDSDEYEWACFQVQQAVEKALKAIYIKKFKKLLKIHDLTLLANQVNAPENIKNYCKMINPAYQYTRYPDRALDEDLSLSTGDFIKYAEEIIRWARKNL